MAMVLNTEVVNGKTIRTWQESRGKKTLTRKFYLQYRVNAICNGKWYSIGVCDTKDEAVSRMDETKGKVFEKYGIDNWHKGCDCLSYLVECGFWWAYNREKSIKLYITEEAKNEKSISEVIN